jgi:hypothetical protein
MMNGHPYGFRIVGDCRERRRFIDWRAAFTAYLQCDERAEVQREGYLSAFTFGLDFWQHLETTGSTKDFAGSCWAPFVWFDVDREDDLQAALHDTRRLVAAIGERLKVPDDALLIFFSGSKGFHAGTSTASWNPLPSDAFHRVARRFAEQLAQAAGVNIDTGIYDRVRAFRSPNSKHPRSGLYKRWLTVDELTGLSLSAILELAKAPMPVEWERPSGTSGWAAELWAECERQVRAQAEAVKARRANGNGSAALNRATLEFIREGADQGDRHRMLYSSARNLGELGASFELAYALLGESALDSGLSPSETCRQIECGITDAAKGGTSNE